MEHKGVHYSCNFTENSHTNVGMFNLSFALDDIIIDKAKQNKKKYSVSKLSRVSKTDAECFFFPFQFF